MNDAQLKLEQGQKAAVSKQGQLISGSWWWWVTALGAALILGLGSLAMFNILARPLALLILGITIALALTPVVQWLNERIPRLLAIILVYLLLLIIAAMLIWIVLPTLIDQAQQVASNAPALLERAQQFIGRTGYLDEFNIQDTLISQIGNMASILISLPVAIASSLFNIAIVLFISLYWLMIIPRLHQFFLSLFKHERRDRVSEILSEMGSAMGGYVRGSVLNGLIVGVLSYIGYLVIGVNFPVVLAVLAGLFELIPGAGPLIAGSVAVLIALLESPTTGLITLVFILVMQQLENHILVPNIMRSQTELSSLLVIFALIAGAAVGGLLGALVAIPLVGVLRVLVVEVIAPGIRRWNDVETPVEQDSDE
jgi:predicted PurR-regulated permease PerM